jgi:hypothetical protein
MPRQQTGEAAPTLTADRQEVKRIAALLKKAPLTLEGYHAVGEQMSRLSSDDVVTRRGGKWRDQVAELAGCSVSTLTKAMQFRGSYQRGKLPGLQELGVGWSRLTIALAVEDKRKRHELLREAQQKGWGERELRRAVQQLNGSKRGGGRPRRQVSSQGPLADAAELLRLTQLWLEFDREVWSHAGEADLREMDEHARSNLSLMLEDVARRLKQLQSRAKQARRVAESLLGESIG